MNRYKKLIGNSAIFALGNFGSRILTMILVPLYTYYLTTGEYGTIDIITSTTSLLLPIISLSIFQSVLRFAMDKNESKETVLTNGVLVTSLGTLLALLTYPILNHFNVLGGLLLYVYLILILQAFHMLIAQFTRAIGKVKIYAINGIIKTLVLGISNIILIVVFKKSIEGYLISYLISEIVAILYLIFATKLPQYINFKSANIKLSKTMIKYSLPLIPNAFMWWLVNASNRYFILYYIGISANGLFAVASKIPTLLSIFTEIFSQAWQLSAIEEYNSEDRSKFYSETFYYYQAFLFLGASAILVVLKSVLRLVLAEDYFMSWRLVPFLLLGVIFSSFSGFLGSNYIAAKETKGVFKTSLVSGVVSIVLNLILIPILGAIGAAISTMISFIIMWGLRFKDTNRFVKMEINVKNLIISLLIILLQIIVLFLNLNTIPELFLLSILFIGLLLSNRRIVGRILKIVLKL